MTHLTRCVCVCVQLSILIIIKIKYNLIQYKREVAYRRTDKGNSGLDAADSRSMPIPCTRTYIPTITYSAHTT